MTDRRLALRPAGMGWRATWSAYSFQKAGATRSDGGRDLGAGEAIATEPRPAARCVDTIIRRRVDERSKSRRNLYPPSCWTRICRPAEARASDLAATGWQGLRLRPGQVTATFETRRCCPSRLMIEMATCRRLLRCDIGQGYRLGTGKCFVPQTVVGESDHLVASRPGGHCKSRPTGNTAVRGW